jgi:hypothetical protein
MSNQRLTEMARICSVMTCIGKLIKEFNSKMYLFFSDYNAQPELDVLSASGLDDGTDMSELSAGARRAAEREMAERDNLVMDEGQVILKFLYFNSSF